MKKFLLLTAVMALSTTVFAQIGPLDFEQGGNGADMTWVTFENTATNPPLEFVANPSKSGLNTSERVAKFTALAAGATWAGTTGTTKSPFYFGETARVIKLMVWKSNISDVGVKLETASGWAQPEIKVANTKVNEWEELTFVFTGRESAPGGEAFVAISVFPDYRSGRTQNTIVHFDNITFSGFSTTAGGGGGGGGGTSPSNYCAKEVTHLGIPAETASAMKLTIANNSSNSMKVTIESANSDPVDLLVIPGDITGSPSISAEDKSVTGKISRTLTWQAPLTEVALNILWSKVSFAGNWQLNASNIKVAFNSTCGSGGGGGGTVATAPTVAAPTPTLAASNVIAVFSDAFTVIPGTNFNPGWGQATQYSSVAIAGNQTIRLGGLNYQGIAFNGNYDVSGMTYLHVDYWTANSTALNVFLISPGTPALENSVALAVPKSEWASVDILLTQFTKPKLSEIFQMKFDGNGDVYLDNIYFHKGQATSTSERDFASTDFDLHQNFPNPFNPTTNISFSVANASHITLDVYNIMGQKMATVVNGYVTAGNHTVAFDASNLASGVYLYKLTAGNYSSVKRMQLLK